MNEQSTQTQQTEKVPTYPFALPPLKYAYSALEPYIDEATMRLHHDKHHQTYIDNLNAAIKDYPQFHKLSIEELMRKITEVPEAIRQTVVNNGGSHANHQFFWKVMSPGMADARPSGDLAAAINKDFGSFDAFKTNFEETGAKHFGSGWVFLVTNKEANRLEILSLPNQESVLPLGKPGLLINDVWEHAYYLKYQNRRPEYLQAWWSVVNWEYIGERLAGIKAGKKQL